MNNRQPRRSRLSHGLLAGLVGAAAVDLAGRTLAEFTDTARRPTLPAQLVAKGLRLPGASNRRRGPARRSLSTLLRFETPDGAGPARVQQVGTTAHYLWGAAWGLLRVGLDSPGGAVHDALAHFIVFAVTDHLLLAATNVGAPVWARRDHPLHPGHDSLDAAQQFSQLGLYITATNLTYSALNLRLDREPPTPSPTTEKCAASQRRRSE